MTAALPIRHDDTINHAAEQLSDIGIAGLCRLAAPFKCPLPSISLPLLLSFLFLKTVPDTHPGSWLPITMGRACEAVRAWRQRFHDWRDDRRERRAAKKYKKKIYKMLKEAGIL